ncbi:MAG TPA: type II secretion system F family protein [Anaerolineae bacterium]|nr:type II secretion system F family protein [Anaerolineae bacterium]HID85106.1 type II secretion system F family protein [Anaerolineales bacterium]HIQ08517.1 type II secretion system F family protein [Anaerolineaceae bacterium]
MSLTLLLLVALGILVLLAYIGLREQRAQEEGKVDPLQARLAEYLDAGQELTSLEEVELQQSFTERVILPLARAVGSWALKFTPRAIVSQAEKRLELAGRPYNLDATALVAFQLSGMIVFGLGVYWLLATSPSPSYQRWSLVGGLSFALIGYYFPQMWLVRLINRRKKEVLRALPDALDLLTICVEAGLGFDAAMRKVSEKWANELAFEFARVLREMQLGKPRKDALRDMADRVDLPQLRSFVAAVVQSEQLGVSMSNVLRIQAEGMRVQRRQRAEEEAHRAPVKMLFPLAFLIMPSIFIVLLGPAVFIVMRSLGGGL